MEFQTKKRFFDSDLEPSNTNFYFLLTDSDLSKLNEIKRTDVKLVYEFAYMKRVRQINELISSLE